LLVLLLIGGGIVVIYAKTNGFTAKAQPSRPERFLAHRLLALSYPASAKTLQNPLPASPENLSRGRATYEGECAVCHCSDGSGDTQIGRGLYPKAPNLRHEVRLSDGELFYIIRNGIRFTGMPGWSDPDDQIWRMVLYLRALPHTVPAAAFSSVSSTGSVTPPEQR
jgi:mono/diheme cytochrome c family protein